MALGTCIPTQYHIRTWPFVCVIMRVVCSIKSLWQLQLYSKDNLVCLFISQLMG